MHPDWCSHPSTSFTLLVMHLENLWWCCDLVYCSQYVHSAL